MVVYAFKKGRMREVVEEFLRDRDGFLSKDFVAFAMSRGFTYNYAVYALRALKAAGVIERIGRVGLYAEYRVNREKLAGIERESAIGK